MTGFPADAVDIRRAQANFKVAGVARDVMDIKSVLGRSLQACVIPVPIQMQALEGFSVRIRTITNANPDGSWNTV